MTFQTNIETLVDTISATIKAIRTDVNGNTTGLGGLTTTNKTNLVAAVNELKLAIDNKSNLNDVGTSNSSTWSSQKIQAALDAVMAGIPDALVDLQKIADLLLADHTNLGVFSPTSKGFVPPSLGGNRYLRGDGSWVDLPAFQICLSISGTPASNQVLARYIATENITLKATLCRASAAVPPDNVTTIRFTVNDVPAGTYTWFSGVTSSVVNLLGADLQVNDVVAFIADPISDPSFKDIALNLGGQRL